MKLIPGFTWPSSSWSSLHLTCCTSTSSSTTKNKEKSLKWFASTAQGEAKNIKSGNFPVKKVKWGLGSISTTLYEQLLQAQIPKNSQIPNTSQMSFCVFGSLSVHKHVESWILPFILIPHHVCNNSTYETINKTQIQKNSSQTDINYHIWVL